MKITQEIHEMDQDRAVPARQTITIEVEPGDDPTGYLNGLILNGTLEAFLTVYAGADAASLAGDPDLWHLLVRFGKVANRSEAKLDQLMESAKSNAGYSWRQIESATEIPQATVRRRVQRNRTTETGKPLCDVTSEWRPDGPDHSRRSHCVKPAGHRGLHSWEGNR